MDSRLEHGVWISMDVNEFGLGEHLKQHFEPTGVGWRLQNQRPAVLESQFLKKLEKR
jgi:hypothetical protein